MFAFTPAGFIYFFRLASLDYFSVGFIKLVVSYYRHLRTKSFKCIPFI